MVNADKPVEAAITATARKLLGVLNAMLACPHSVARFKSNA
jgi:hypothetical protein